MNLIQCAADAIHEIKEWLSKQISNKLKAICGILLLLTASYFPSDHRKSPLVFAVTINLLLWISTSFILGCYYIGIPWRQYRTHRDKRKLLGRIWFPCLAFLLGWFFLIYGYHLYPWTLSVSEKISSFFQKLP